MTPEGEGGTVFISYSHDGPDHIGAVLALSNRLRGEGVDCVLDQYESCPPEGWPRWMDREIKKAQFVLMICTEAYYRRVMGEESPGVGLGIAWEGSLIYNHIYASGSLNTKFIPVIFRDEDVKYIPTPIQGATRYCISSDDGYEQLYSRLIGRPPAEKPSLGKRNALPRREVKTLFIPLPTQHGDTGSGEGEFNQPRGITLDKEGNNIYVHPQFSGARFSKNGRFSRLTNTQLKEKACQVSAKLLSLRAEYKKKCGPNLVNIHNAGSW